MPVAPPAFTRPNDRRFAVSLITPEVQPVRVAPGAPYLDKLNDAQRAAVEHGIGDDAGEGEHAGPGGPLLVIAGAGSGKTNTLAHPSRICWCAVSIPGACCC